MSTPYQRGAEFERKVQAEMEHENWLVVRSPASKSPFDLMALKLDTAFIHEAVLVQCKLYGDISKAEENELTDVCEAYACLPVLAYKLPRGKEIHYKNLLTGKSWTP